MKISFSPTSSPELFDHRLRQIRAQRYTAEQDFLGKLVCERLIDRLSYIKRVFPEILILGHTQNLIERITGSANGQEKITSFNRREDLPFAPDTFNLTLSLLNLQWINDLPGYLWRLRNILKPDGLFIGTLLGDDTLKELRSAMLQAEMEILDGASSRIIPMIDLYTASQLLLRAQFTLPVADKETIKVTYPSLTKLIQDLRYMGLTNPMHQRDKRFLGKRFFERVETIYLDKFSSHDHKLVATFDIIFLTGWSPHESQQQSLKPGSAFHRLQTVLGEK